MRGNHLVAGGLIAGIVFWVLPSVFAQGQSTFLLIVLAAVFGFATGIPASKKYSSLLADGSLESPTVRLFAQLGVLGAQLLIAFALMPLVSQI